MSTEITIEEINLTIVRFLATYRATVNARQSAEKAKVAVTNRVTDSPKELVDDYERLNKIWSATYRKTAENKIDCYRIFRDYFLLNDGGLVLKLSDGTELTITEVHPGFLNIYSMFYSTASAVDLTMIESVKKA